jgi:hypothetical protein
LCYARVDEALARYRMIHDELLQVYLSRILAQALGLEHYEWLSYSYIASDSPEEHPDVIAVE